MQNSTSFFSKASRWFPVLFAGVFGLIAGVLLSSGPKTAEARVQSQKDSHDAKKQGPRSLKAPIEEVLHCPLAFKGVHLLKDLPEFAQYAYHYCKPLDSGVAQCVLYDGTGPDAKLIGLEYLVSDEIHSKMPEEEKIYWHDHKYEIDSGLLDSLIQDGEEERKTMAGVRTLWGKVFHTWATGKTYPMGPPKLFWSVTGEAPFLLPDSLKTAR